MQILEGTPKAKAALWPFTDTEMRKRGEQRRLDRSGLLNKYWPKVSLHVAKDVNAHPAISGNVSKKLQQGFSYNPEGIYSIIDICISYVLF